MKSALFLALNVLFISQLGCGVKSKPLAPLKEPWISTGEIEKDREKKFKNKKPADNRVELGSPAPDGADQATDKKEL